VCLSRGGCGGTRSPRVIVFGLADCAAVVLSDRAVVRGGQYITSNSGGCVPAVAGGTVREGRGAANV
jgi:hypothetical protein